MVRNKGILRVSFGSGIFFRLLLDSANGVYVAVQEDGAMFICQARDGESF